MKAYKKRLLGLLILAVLASAAVIMRYEPGKNTTTSNSSMIPNSYGEVQTPVEKMILESFRKGDAGILSPYLSEEVNLTILEEEEYLSKTETTSALQQFFDNHRPTSMVKKHSGLSKRGGGQYLIGVLSTQRGEEYRCHFFMESEKIASIEIRLEGLAK